MSTKKSTVVINLPDDSKPAGSLAGQKGQGKRRSKKKKSRSGNPPGPPSVMSSGYKRSAPRITSGDGRIRVSHREYLGPVTTGLSFALSSFELNPGLVSTFPWLSSIARLYESYLFQNLTIEYLPTCGTSTEGSLAMAIDYDAFDYPPVLKRDFMSNQGAVSVQVWDKVSLSSSASNLKKFGIQRYTRAGGLAANLDIKTYDIGKFYYSAESSSNRRVGDLYISYTIDFFTPQSPHWDNWQSEKIEVTDADEVNTFPTTPGGTQVFGDLGIEVMNVNSLRFLRAGSYMLNTWIAGPSAPGLNSYLDSTLAAGVGTVTSLYPTVNQNDTTVQSRRIDITSPGAVFRFMFTNIAEVAHAALRFTPYSPLVT